MTASSQQPNRMVWAPMSLEEIVAELSLAEDAKFTVTAGPLEGLSNHVYEIRFDRGDRWCLRIPLTDFVSWLASRGTAILQALKQRKQGLRVPAVISTTSHYTVLEYLDGTPLGSWNTETLTRARRQLLLDHLGVFLFSLWTMTITNDERGIADDGQRATHREFLREEVDRGLRRTLSRTSAWGDPIHYLYRRAKIDELVPDPDNSTQVIRHGDLNAWNIVVYSEGLSGVVDWDTAKLAPAPATIQHPLFMADIPGWRNDDVPESMTFEQDRAYLEDVVGRLDASSESPGKVEKLLRTSFERQFFELSLHNQRINEQYVSKRFDHAGWSRTEALDQLDEFLSSHESMKALPAVVDLRETLNSETST